jgi:hypothetical protein
VLIMGDFEGPRETAGPQESRLVRDEAITVDANSRKAENTV